MTSPETEEQMELNLRLASLSEGSASSDAWPHTVIDPSMESQKKDLARLLDSGEVHSAHDTIRAQVVDLIRARHPSRRLTEAELEDRILDHVNGRPWHEYGRWVFYPWSRRLVHILAPDEFRELRTDRNRYKITTREQAALAEKRIGVVGLSVGQAAAVTMALEGVGGLLRLADLDHLELSNMNRLRAGVHHLGLNKALLAAQQIAEIDPYLPVEVFTEGITEQNMEKFLEERRLDLLIEECDDLYLKVRIREEARLRSIPVLMDTSDRGLIDIERFDSEPLRPLFHGLAGSMEASSLRGLSTTEKIPYVLRIMGEDRLSPRAAASLVEVEQTISTWPQLASGVTLGAAVTTDVARRILLGELEQSGRFYVDLEAIVADGAGETLGEAGALTVQTVPESLQPASSVSFANRAAKVDADAVASLVSAGILAPSGGNCQPWRFVWSDCALSCYHDRSRSHSYLDFKDSATHLAFGAVVENIHVAATEAKLGMQLDLFPDPEDEELLCRLRFSSVEESHPDPHLAELLTQRVTNRRLGRREPLSQAQRDILLCDAERAGTSLQLVEDDDALDEMGSLLGTGDRLRFLNQTMHAEMMGEIRWTPEEVERTRDGLDVATLELTGADLAAMRVISSWTAMKTLGRFGGGSALEKPAVKSVRAASAMGLITVEGTSPVDWFTGGRAMQRVWLRATSLGLVFQPMTALTYLFFRLHQGETTGMDDSEVEILSSLRRRFAGVFNVSGRKAEPMLFRLARAERPTARSLRRNLEDVLEFC